MGGRCRILRVTLWLILTCLLLDLPVVQALAPEELYLQQKRGNSCTLCASTMMIRSLLHQAGSDDWQAVTESDVRTAAWTSAGLSWNWTYKTGESTVKVGHKHIDGIRKKKVQKLLEEYPEGIVLYCGGDVAHGVFITDCTEGIVYCADPANTYSGERIPLSKSLLGDRAGSQSSILAAATAYWYIAESEIILPEPVREVCPPTLPVAGRENVPARL